jgi:hypothetical protein
MDLEFERKLRAAVSAGWRVLVIQVGLLTIVWVAYLGIIAARPAALLALWGPQVTWSTVATVSLVAIAVYKVSLWLQAALLAWAWMWASSLRRMREGSAERLREPEGREGPPAGARAASAGR